MSCGNDIDIISIGTLYTDPRWEKKYWSASRGRNRYPYPVGYEASRIYNGINSTIQILQGTNGPLFQITSSDGHSCCGPTPDIAWKMYRKACSPSVKSYCKKRLSSNIDGAEFFGFKYSTVQQLLRQLVTDSCRGMTGISKAVQSKECPNQSGVVPVSENLAEVCMEDRGGQKRKLEQMELLNYNKPKKLNRSSTGATEDFSIPHHIESPNTDDENIRASAALGVQDNDAPTREGSPGRLSQQREVWLSNPISDSENNYCDSAGDDITISMMKLLLPQAVPFLRRTRQAKKNTADTDYMDSKKNGSFSQDHNKTTQASASFKEIVPDCINTNFDEHTDLEKLSDVPDSWEELDDNVYIPDSCEGLDNNAHIPDSCDELDKNAYVADSCDELGKNAHVLDYCDELDGKGITPNFPKRLNENHYGSDSSDTLDISLYVPDSGDESEEKNHISTKRFTVVGVKRVMQDSDASALYDDQRAVDNCVSKEDLKAESNKACVPDHNLCEKVLRCSSGRSSAVNNEQLREENADMPHSNDDFDNKIPTFGNKENFGVTLKLPGTGINHGEKSSTDVSGLTSGKSFEGHNSKLCTVSENENRSSNFGQLNEFPVSDMVTDEELLMCEKIAFPIVETLHRKNSTFVDDSNKSAGCNTFDGNKSLLARATEHENKLSGFGKLVGVYAHPNPVLSMLLCLKGSEAYICTSCGTFQDNQRTLFMYIIKVNETKSGRPSFIGHSQMLLPDPKCFFGKQIALDKSAMQFTPDGKNLVLLNSMKLPTCRNRLVQCQCLECETHCHEENAVKIVELMDGYVKVLAKLITVHSVLCLLVCEPCYLVAVEGNGAFRFWTMNTTWRCVMEEFILPPTDCIFPSVFELKQIPNCSHLVVGHNCLGEFGLWDVLRRTIISRFSIPNTAVFSFTPLSLYSRNRKDYTFTCLNTNDGINSLRNMSTQWSSQRSTYSKLNLSDQKDIVISMLVATCPGIKSSNPQMPDGCWKLGLLMNKKVVLNRTLDARAVTVAASGDCGVLGTNQGYLHVWNLCTGVKLGASLCFKDGRVQCIYTDNTNSGLLAVADDSGKLLLYLGGQDGQTLPTEYL